MDAVSGSHPPRIQVFLLPSFKTSNQDQFSRLPPPSPRGCRHFLIDQAEPLQQLLLVNCGGVAEALTEEALELGTVAIDLLGEPCRRDARDVFGELNAQDVGPLLERFVGTLGTHEAVGQSVGDLHAGSTTSVSRV